jgi:hypothetical protein
MMSHASSSAPRGVRGLFRKAALVAAFSAIPVVSNAGWPAGQACPNIYSTGVFPTGDINPAFSYVGMQTMPNGTQVNTLIFSSFFNAIKADDPTPAGNQVVSYFQRDLVAQITGINYRHPSWFRPDRDIEIISDRDLATPDFPSAPGQTVWPNEVATVPDGILPFEAVVVPEGFHVQRPHPEGRLTIINTTDPARTTYDVDVISDPDGVGINTCFGATTSPPRFYHEARWFDMDGDGLKDLITVRSGFKASPLLCTPLGELVWFKNPGASIDPNVEWDEFVVYTAENGPEIAVDIHDFENDGVPEFVGNNFFAQGFYAGEHILLMGAPLGGDWTDVDLVTNPARVAVISDDQGAPFGVRIADLNGDGIKDVLATNHQGDNCKQTSLPGRIYALQPPASGDIFNDPWTTHILKDNIRPNISYPNPQNSGPGRLAPGLAQTFYPSAWDEAMFNKPWIVAGGDEASKVWVLKPNSQSDVNDWTYESAIIFDINDYYGPNTSQTFSAPPPATGVSISTIGAVSWAYDRPWAWGSYAEIYIPVFEGRDIHRISFRPNASNNKITCPTNDSQVGVCTVP